MSSKKRSTPPSSKAISVGRDVVDSVVINGDNNVVNYFKGEYVSLKEHYIPPDSVFQRVRTEDFVGRDWLTAQVDAFLNDPHRKSGAFLLIGDAGVGKTSFMAHLVKDRGYLHLFAEQVPGQAMLQRAIQSIGSQLVTRYHIDPYKDRDTLIQGTVFPDFLERLLRMAASKLTGGEKIIIVCDALDEAGTFSDGNVFGLPNVLPDGVYLILSQRPVNVKLPNLEPLTVRLETQGADNLGDMEIYLRVVAQRAAVADQRRAKNYSDVFFIQTLKEKSLGVWMYLHYVIKEIEQGSRAPLELEALPTGLVGYYADFWGDWRMGRKGRGEGEKAWNALYAPLLTTLAAAQEAITIGTLIQWAEVDADEDEATRLVAEDWSAFIEEKEVGAETRYKPYHLSFADFIAGRADHEKLPPAQKNLVRDLAKRTVKAHQHIVQVFESECDGQWDRLVEREYPRLHLSAHLNGAGNFETLRILLTEGDDKIKWAEAREQKEETYAGYLNDLSYVWAYAEREQNYALAIRCMLIENSIHSLALHIPPGLLVELAKVGVWNYTRCLSIIKQKSIFFDKAESLKLITSDLPPSLIQEAFEIACEIKEENELADVLIALAPKLNDDLQIQALSIADKVKDEHIHARVLAALAPYLKNDLKMQILSTVCEFTMQSACIYALRALVPHLNDEGKAQAISSTQKSGKIKFFNYHEILSTLAPHLNEKLKIQAVSAAREIKDANRRANSLIALVPHLTDDLKDQVIQEALTTIHYAVSYDTGKELRALALANLAPYLRDDQKNKVLQEILTIMHKIKYDYPRARVLIALAPHLNDRFKTWACVVARKIKDEDNRAKALTALFPYLNNDLKKQIFNDLLEIKFEYYRENALTTLAPSLSEELKIKMLSVAHEFRYEDASVRVLIALFPYLSDELKSLALSTIFEFKDKSSRVDALIAFIPHLNDKIKTTKIQLALSTAHEIKDEFKLARTLSALVPHLSGEQKIQTLQEALFVSRKIGDEYDRIHAVTDFIPYLNWEMKRNVLQETLSAAHKISYETYLSSALTHIASYLDDNLKAQVLQDALSIAREIEKEQPRARALIALAPHLEFGLKAQVLQEALSSAHGIKEEQARAEVLTALVPHLENDMQPQVIQEVLFVARKIEHEFSRVKTLSILIPYLNDDLTSQSLQDEVLFIAREIKDETSRIYALASLVQYLPDKLKTQVIQESLSIIYEIEKIRGDFESRFASALVSLAPYLTDDLKNETLAATNQIKKESDRAKILSDLVPYLNGDIQIVILQELLYVSDWLFLSDKNPLIQVFNTWKDIEFKGMKENIILFTKFMSQKSREEGVVIVGALTPSLVYFDGEKIVPELYRAVQDTARWWP